MGGNREDVMHRYFDEVGCRHPYQSRSNEYGGFAGGAFPFSITCLWNGQRDCLRHGNPRGGQQKYILRNLAERVGVPRQALYRPKQGFALPLVHWIRNELKELIMSVLLEPELSNEDFKPEGVRQLLDEHFRERRDHSDAIWRLLIFELWHRNFLEKIRTTDWGANPCGVYNSGCEPGMSLPVQNQTGLNRRSPLAGK
jgi:hypothetical protein